MEILPWLDILCQVLDTQLIVILSVATPFTKTYCHGVLAPHTNIIDEIKEKINNLLIHCIFCCMEMNDTEIDNVMIDVDVDGMELDATNAEGYPDTSEAYLEELFLTAASDYPTLV